MDLAEAYMMGMGCGKVVGLSGMEQGMDRMDDEGRGNHADDREDRAAPIPIDATKG